MDTGGEHHIPGSIGGNRRGTAGVGSRGGIALGVMPDVGEWEEGSKSHSHMCTYATILHVLHMFPKPKMQ